MDLAAIVFGNHYEVLKLSDSQVDSENSKKLVDVYQFEKDFYRPHFKMTVSETDGRLFTDWGKLIPMDDNTFIARAFWSDVSFETDPNRKAIYLIYDGFKGNRIQE